MKGRRTLPLALSLVVVACTVGAYFYGGRAGALGMILGLSGTTLNVAAGWLAIRLTSRMVTSQPQPVVEVEDGKPLAPSRRTALANLLLGFAVLLKLPIVVGAGMVAWRIGGSATTTFLTGLGLVYSALFGWALLRQ